MIYDNKKSLKRKWMISSLIVSIVLSLPVFYFYSNELLNGLIIFFILLVAFFLFSFFLSFSLFYKRKHRIMKIENGIFTYSSNRISHDIKASSICGVRIGLIKRKRVSYLFFLDDGNEVSTDDISIKSKSVLDHMELNKIEEVDIRVPLSKRFSDLNKSIIKLIKEYRNQIALIVIGLLITVLSFILYSKFKDNLYISLIMLFVSLSYGLFHTYRIYIKTIYNDDSISTRIVLTAILSIIYNVIVFLLMLVVFMLILKKEFSVDYIYYTVFLYPSLTVVVLFIILITLFIVR